MGEALKSRTGGGVMSGLLTHSAMHSSDYKSEAQSIKTRNYVSFYP